MSNPEYSGQETTLVPGTLRGFRQWIYDPAFVDLPFRALSYPIRWPQELRASCTQKICSYDCPQCIGFHKPPVTGCTCGIYALYEPEQLQLHIEMQMWKIVPTPLRSVPGVIEASGRILMGTQGFRAERAKMVAIYFGRARGRPSKKILDQYPDVEFFTSFNQMVRAYPAQDLSGIIDLAKIRAQEAEAHARALDAAIKAQGLISLRYQSGAGR